MNTQVDTGWVTDNAPGGRGAVARAHETHVAPPLDDNDGASRAPRAKKHRLGGAATRPASVPALVGLAPFWLRAAPRTREEEGP